MNKKIVLIWSLLFFIPTAQALFVKNNTKKNIVIVNDSYIKNDIISPNIKGKKIKPKQFRNVKQGKKHWVLYRNEFYQFYFPGDSLGYAISVQKGKLNLSSRSIKPPHKKLNYNSIRYVICPANISKKLLK